MNTTTKYRTIRTRAVPAGYTLTEKALDRIGCRNLNHKHPRQRRRCIQCGNVRWMQAGFRRCSYCHEQHDSDPGITARVPMD